MAKPAQTKSAPAPEKPAPAVRRPANAPQIDDENDETGDPAPAAESNANSASARPGTAVTSAKSQQVALPEGMTQDLLDEIMEDADAGHGFEREDLAIPYLVVLQTNSPQVNPAAPEYIEGAKAGMLYNTVTGDVYSGEAGVVLIPVAYTRGHRAWFPRDSRDGKGLYRDFGSDPSILQKSYQSPTSKKTMIKIDGKELELVVSGDHFVYIVDEGTGEFTQAMFSLSSTQLKQSRRWNTTIAQTVQPNPIDPTRTFRPASFFMTYLVTTEPESNDRGRWFGVRIAQHGRVLDLPNGEAVYRSARSFRKMIDEGVVRVAPATRLGEVDEDGSAPAPTADRRDGDPF